MKLETLPNLESLIKNHIYKAVDYYKKDPKNLDGFYYKSFLSYEVLKLRIHWFDAFSIFILLKSFCSTDRYANRRLD